MNGEDRQQPGEIPGGGKEQEEEFPEKPAVDVDEDGGEEEPKAKGFIIYLAMMMSSDPYHSMATETGQRNGIVGQGKTENYEKQSALFLSCEEEPAASSAQFCLSSSIFQKKSCFFYFLLLAFGFWLFPLDVSKLMRFCCLLVFLLSFIFMSIYPFFFFTVFCVKKCLVFNSLFF